MTGGVLLIIQLAFYSSFIVPHSSFLSMPDMLVNLLRLPPLEPLPDESRGAGLSVRRAQPWELTPVREFVARHFAEAWADEISVGFARQPVSVFVASRAGSL